MYHTPIHYSELIYVPEINLSILIFFLLSFFTLLEYYHYNDNLNKICGYLSIIILFQMLYYLINVFLNLNIKGSFLYFQYNLDIFLIFFKIIILFITIICILFTIIYSFLEKIIH